eukprot:scaffold9079_cov120-Cylindrotheca_fusiformis.AAC.3
MGQYLHDRYCTTKLARGHHRFQDSSKNRKNSAFASSHKLSIFVADCAEEDKADCRLKTMNNNQEGKAVAEPDTSKGLTRTTRIVGIVAGIVAIGMLGAIIALAVRLEECSSSKEELERVQSGLENTQAPVGLTNAPTSAPVETTATPTFLRSVSPTLNPSTSPTSSPSNNPSSNPLCQVDYPDTPELTCVSREENYGEDAIAYTLEVDCSIYGDYESQTGLWESGRTKGILSDENGIIFDDNRDGPAGRISRSGNCWLSFAIETSETPRCLSIRFQDDLCNASYQSNCLHLNTCSWD